ncbi:MAG: CAP domain-containing protein [Planctomycetota bacterium]
MTMLRFSVACCVVLAGLGQVRAQGFDPSADEQYMLELTNRMRLDPAPELGLLVDNLDPISSPYRNIDRAIDFFNVDGQVLQDQWDQLVPAPPVAWSPELYDAAYGHNLQMIAQDDQSHQLPGEPGLAQRVEAAGYTGWNALAENIYAYSEDPLYGHAGFVIDWGSSPTGIQDPPGHRINIMNPNYREVGISIVEETDPATDVGLQVTTQDFGSRFGLSNTPWLLGTAFDDAAGDGDGFYSPGEGLGGVLVDISQAGALLTTATTLSAGSFQVQLSPGTYDLVFYGPALGGAWGVDGIVIGSQNVKQDLSVGLAAELLDLGDVDLDGDVDLSDASVLLSGYGSSGTGYLGGDLNGDGVVNSADTELLLGNWSPGGGAALAVMPEPAGLGVLLAGAAGLIGRRRRRGA